MNEIGIGSTVWVMDVNRRVYDDKRKLIYREQWRPMTIVGETSRSWITDWYSLKLPKKGGGYLTSEEQLDEMVWIHDNKYPIVRKLERCNDYASLKAVAEIVGYTV